MSGVMSELGPHGTETREGTREGPAAAHRLFVWVSWFVAASTRMHILAGGPTWSCRACQGPTRTGAAMDLHLHCTPRGCTSGHNWMQARSAEMWTVQREEPGRVTRPKVTQRRGPRLHRPASLQLEHTHWTGWHPAAVLDPVAALSREGFLSFAFLLFLSSFLPLRYPLALPLCTSPPRYIAALPP